MAAFRHAVALGYGYLETDVHVTRDGVLRRLPRRAARPGQRRRAAASPTSTSTDVRRVRVGGASEVPTLAELVDAFPDARFNLDLKADGAVRAARRRSSSSAGLHDRVLVGSFSARRLRRFRALAGPPGAHLRRAARGGGVRRRSRAASPDRLTRGRAPPSRSRTASGADRSPPAGWYAAPTPRGVHVHVWTVDDPDEMRLLLDLGVDGLMTDRTDVLATVLRRARPVAGDERRPTAARSVADLEPARAGPGADAPGTGTTGPTPPTTRPS